MRTIIYGVGKRYNMFFENLFMMKRIMFENELEVTGVADSNNNILGEKVICNGQNFIVRSIEEFGDANVEAIVVTTKKYFYEIQAELLEKGYQKEQILLIDDLYESYLERRLCVPKFEGKIGIEIGGPTELFSGIYAHCLTCDNVNFNENTVWIENDTGIFEYKGSKLGRNWIADATDMHQIKSAQYDFVLSSNNLEHIANPLKALKEFARIIKHGGKVVVIVPRKEVSFDHNRECTLFEHLLEDYVNDVGEDDLSHLSEIVEKHDYSMDIECGGKEKFIKRAEKNIENRCLHHHVFEENCLRKSLEFVGLEVSDFIQIVGNWCIVGEKKR